MNERVGLRWPGGADGSARMGLWGLVFVVALVVRVLCLLELRDDPGFLYPVSDARSYSDWGQEIAAGDWLGRSRGVFYQAPLYPYLIGGVLALGGDLETVRWAQVVASSAACLLIGWAGGLLFGRRSGLAAGFLLALYGPAVFYDTLLQKESAGLLAFSGLLLALAGTQRRPENLPIWGAAGACLALLTLLRENTLVLLPVLLLWAVLRTHRRGMAAVMLVAGLAIVLLPVAARNAWVGGEWVVTTSQAGPNFYIGNHEGASGLYEPLRAGRSDTPFEQRDATILAENAVGRALSPREVSRYWFRKGVEFWSGSPVEALSLWARKMGLVVHPVEIPDAHDLYLARTGSRVLRALSPFGMGLLLPLAFAGLALRWPDQRALLLGSMVLALWVAVALFFVMGRYRFYLVPPLILLAGSLVGAPWEGVRGRRYRWLVAILLLGLLWGLLPIRFLAPVDRSMAWVNRGVAWAGQGRFEAAASDYREALRMNPRSVEANANLGSVLRVVGRPAEALLYLETASSLAPRDGQIAAELGATHFALGDWSAALRDLERAQDLGDQREAVADLVRECRSRLQAGSS